MQAMGSVDWVRLDVHFFENRKIQRLLSIDPMYPLLFLRIICLAGIVNDAGSVYVSPTVPFEAREIGAALGMKPAAVEKGLQAMCELGMIAQDEAGFLWITGWEKHQFTDKLEEIRAKNAERQRRFRRNRKQDEEEIESFRIGTGANSNVTHNVT